MKENDYKYRIDRVLEYINDNLDSAIDIQKLADISAFSLFHFHRIARAYLKEPIGAYIIRQKMQRAARFLVYEDISITDIAYRVGYDTPSSLTKAFVKYFGVPPIEYRISNKYQIMTTQIENFEIKISKGKAVELESKTIIYIKAIGKYADIDWGTYYQRLYGEVGHQGIYSAGIECLALFHNNPKDVSESELITDVCLRICKPAVANEDVGVKTIEGGRYAMFKFVGEYTKLGYAYDKIYGELLAKNSFEPRGNYCFEKHVSDPRRTAPEKLKTEIYIPIL